MIGLAALEVELRENEQRQGGRWNAACGQQQAHPPLYVLVQAMDESAAAFRNGGVEQVCANSGGWVNPKKQDEQGCHEGSPAHARKPDQQPHEEPRK